MSLFSWRARPDSASLAYARRFSVRCAHIRRTRLRHARTVLIYQIKNATLGDVLYLAGPTGFEPAISSVTGRHVRPLHHEPAWLLTSNRGNHTKIFIVTQALTC